MEQLIKVSQNEKNENVVSARDLHKFLGVKDNVNTWFKNQVERAMLEENIDFTTLQLSKVDGQGGLAKLDYAICISASKEIAMLNGGEKGKQARKYFIECERQLQKPKEFTIKELLLLQLETIERAEKAERTVHILTHVNKTYTSTEIAKEIGFKSANEMNKKLHDLGVQYKQNETWILYSKYSGLAYVDIKQEVLDSGKIIYHRRWTGIGREFLINLLNPKA